jgi:hypothetical protein
MERAARLQELQLLKEVMAEKKIEGIKSMSPEEIAKRIAELES